PRVVPAGAVRTARARGDPEPEAASRADPGVGEDRAAQRDAHVGAGLCGHHHPAEGDLLPVGGTVVSCPQGDLDVRVDRTRLRGSGGHDHERNDEDRYRASHCGKLYPGRRKALHGYYTVTATTSAIELNVAW